MSRIVVLLGHPDARGGTFCHALAQAYEDGARAGGHDCERIDVAALDFPLLRSAAEFHEKQPPESLKGAQAAIGQADHLVVIYPLWMGSMPALLKGFLEQVLRPGFAFPESEGGFPKGQLRNSARVIVTMGMPGLIYRYWFGAHGLKSLERNILKFCGMHPVRDTIFGLVEARSPETRRKWLDQVRELGRRAR